METLYRRIEIKEGNSTEPVQYVGVYALNWQKEWGEPEAAFVEEEPLPPQKQVTVDEIGKILSHLKVDGNRSAHQYWIDSKSKQAAAKAIHKLYGEKGGNYE